MSLHDQLKEIATFAPPLLSSIKPSIWAEQHRVMPSDNPFPGKFKFDKTPYCREILDRVSEDDPARIIAIMKGSQLGMSTCVIENAIVYKISESPSTMLLTATNETLMAQMMETKIDPAIEGCGLGDLIGPSIVRKSGSRSGNTSQSKEFAGGWLKLMSNKSAQNARQMSVKTMFLDDIDAAVDSKSAGDPIALFKTRAEAFWNNGMKLFIISTPETKALSHIEPVYLHGDQRKYHIPCECCGDQITLEWSTMNAEGDKCGLTYKLDNHGRVIKKSVGYICQSCGGFFQDKNKYKFLNAGEWKPTSEAKEEGFFSYHVSSLYAPLGMKGWYDYAAEYVKACPPRGEINQSLYKTFVNTCLGETWEEKTKKVDAKGISLNTRGYEIGTIPIQQSVDDGNGVIVYITCACDIGGHVDDGRLDYEIVAWSESGTSYSIDHGSIGTFIPNEAHKKNKVDREMWTYEIFGGRSIWAEFKKVIDKTYLSEDGKTEFVVDVTGVDTGYLEDKCYAFIDSYDGNIVGLKGRSIQDKESVDKLSFTPGKKRGNLYIVEGNMIKDRVSSNMMVQWDGETEQPVGYMNFPTPSEGKYTYRSFFIQYEAEERQIRKSKTSTQNTFQWVKPKKTSQNHFWDCRVYNEVLKDIYCHIRCKRAKVLNSWTNFVQILSGEI